MPCALTAGDCRLAGVGVTRLAYEADGWGVGELWLSDGLVVEIDHPRPGRSSAPAMAPSLARVRPRDLARLGDRLSAWFRGSRDDFLDVGLELEWATPFTRVLVDALRNVPYGETVTYGELAALAGRPGAARAAGTFCARNRFAVVVPCHRVVGAAGLGGYGSLGLDYKQRLLDLEAVSARGRPRTGRRRTRFGGTARGRESA
jgi:methylated-DNA-[protein]-cysteine S-methyltransferase